MDAAPASVDVSLFRCDMIRLDAPLCVGGGVSSDRRLVGAPFRVGGL